MQQTRIGFIGAGMIANRHLGNLLGFGDVKVMAVSDLDLDRARAAATRFRGTPYSDYAAMLEREELDAVFICVPPFGHGPPERAVLERGLPFFVEKPIAVDLETAEAIAHEVEARGVVTATGYHWRYLDIVERARDLLSRNPPRLALGYWLDFTPPPGWWTRESQSGGQMIEQATHVLDLARVLVGEVTRLYAAGSRTERPAFPDADIFDVATATLHFASGALGSIATTCLLHWPHRIGLHLFAEGLAVELSEFDIIVDVGNGRPVEQARGNLFVREARAFVDAVQGRPDGVRAPYAVALRTHRVACAITRSAQEGTALALAA